MSEQDVRAATDAGMRSREALQANYQANIAGEGTAAGDPAEAESTLQSYVPDAKDAMNTKATV